MLAEAVFQGYIHYKPFKNNLTEEQIEERKKQGKHIFTGIWGQIHIVTKNINGVTIYHKQNIVAYDEVAELIQRNFPLNYGADGNDDGSVNYQVIIQCTLIPMAYKTKRGKILQQAQWRINRICPVATKEEIQELTGYVKEEKLNAVDFKDMEDLDTDNDWEV